MKNYKTIYNLVAIIAGSFVFACGVNIFLQPLNIYSGGFLGLSQIIRDFLQKAFKLDSFVDLAGIVNLILNLWVVLFSYKCISKSFAVKTLFAIVLQGIFLLLIPISKYPLISDTVIGLSTGSFLVAIGTILVFSGGGSGGGLDIIGIYCNKKGSISIGRIYLVFNVLIYTLCLVMYDIQIAIYSLIHAVILSGLIEYLHYSNREVQILIITKNENLGNEILERFNRGVTLLHGIGGYTGEQKHIVLFITTKNTVKDISRIVQFDSVGNFMIVSDSVKVVGSFEKRVI